MTKECHPIYVIDGLEVKSHMVCSKVHVSFAGNVGTLLLIGRTISVYIKYTCA